MTQKVSDTLIHQLSDHVGKTVRIKGWLYNKRSSGKIRFLLVRDGTGIVQSVMVRGEIDDDTFNLFEEITQETSLMVTGIVREDRRAPGGFELTLNGVEVVSISEEYPITPKSHGTTFLMDNRHLWLRSRRQVAILRCRNEIIKSIRDFFYDHKYVLVDTPILTGAIGESAGTLFKTEYFDEGYAYLAQTGQLYLEAAAAALGRVFCFGPTFRAEKSKTRRHLTEFWMVEAEMSYMDSDDNMDLQEELICFVVERALENCASELAELERDVSRLQAVRVPFPRVSYDEAVELLQKQGSSIQWGSDLGGEDETIVAESFDQPVFVYNYPKEAKAFYMKPHPQRDDVVLCDDLLAPEGYGEIIGGSQRNDDLESLTQHIEEEQLPIESYDWYLDLRRFGSVPHSGFGLGVERTVAWICGLPHIRESIPFPRLMNRLRP